MFRKINLKYLSWILGAGILFIIVRDLYMVLFKGYVYNESLLNLVGGVFFGIVTNFVVWYYLLHGLAPKLEFSESISKLKSRDYNPDNPKHFYRIKLRNGGSRDVIDVEIIARFTLKGIGRFKKNWKHYYIPFSSDGEKSYRITRMSPGQGHSRVLHLQINSVPLFRTNEYFPQEFREKATQKSLELEDLFALDPSAYIQIHAFCYDGFSGSRKLFLSKQYEAIHIEVGAFDAAGLGIKKKSVHKVKTIIEESDDEIDNSIEGSDDE